METQKLNTQEMHLEESDFDDFDPFEDTSQIFILVSFFIFTFLPFATMYIAFNHETRSAFLPLFIISLISYFFFMISFSVRRIIFTRRLKLSLAYFKKTRITYNSELNDFEYEPKDLPTLSDNWIWFMLLLLIELIVIIEGTTFLADLFPDLNNMHLLAYMSGFFIFTFLILTIALLMGIWYWNPSRNYYAESFYFLKSIVNDDEKEGMIEFTCQAFRSFFDLIQLYGFPRDFDAVTIEKNGDILAFFSPEKEAIGEHLNDQITQILVFLKEKEWLEVLLTIEKIEDDLEEAKMNLKSRYLLKEYVTDEKSENKLLKSVRKQIFDLTIIKIIVPVIFLVILAVLGVRL